MTLAFNASARRFPRIAWAWPDGGLHDLLTAAICPDDAVALNAFGNWLSHTDLDDATFAEHRLLAAITSRFGERLADRPEYARLCGLQRLNWTRSRLAVRATMPVLQQMVEAGLRPVLLKGAARVALEPSEQKARTSYDVDLLLSDSDFNAAFEILAADGWQSTRGESAMGLRARISSVRARNFKKGQFGDVDIHRRGYHDANSNSICDREVFEDLSGVDFYGVPLFVPGPEERLAMAIGHGCVDGHAHSDWLVDASRILLRETVDWEKFMFIVRSRKLGGQGAVAFSYLHHALGVPMPESVVERVCGRSGFASPSQVASVLLAKDSATLSKSQRVLRKIIAEARKARYSGRDRSRDVPVFRAVTRRARGVVECAGREQLVETTDALGPGRSKMDISISFEAPRMRRRVEFELTGSNRTVCHLQSYYPRVTDGRVTVRFRGVVQLHEDDLPLRVSAVAGKILQSAAIEEERKYGPVKFVIDRATFRAFRSPR